MKPPGNHLWRCELSSYRRGFNADLIRGESSAGNVFHRKKDGERRG